MAENQLSSLMQVDIPAPGRSNFNRGFINRFTASCGYGYPAAVLEVLPNTRCKIGLDSLIKSDPLVSSLYGTFRQSWQAYFIPSRLYVKELDQNQRLGITNEDLEICQFPVIANGTINSQFSGTETFVNPAIQSYYKDSPYHTFSIQGFEDRESPGYVLPGSLLDMLGMFPANFDFRRQFTISSSGGAGNDSFTQLVGKGLNAIPFIGYYDIFRNYYYNMQDPYPSFVVSETNDSVTLDDTSFPLANLDKMIGDIYNRAGTTPIVSSDYPTAGESLNSHFNILRIPEWRDLFNRMISPIDWYEVVGSVDEPNRVHAGYWRRCYDDDYFTSRLTSSYVGELDTTARVTVSNNVFSVQQYRLASRNYKYVKKNILTNGQRYDEWLEVHYGAKLNRALNIPHFLGSMSTDFYFEDIYATASTGANENGSVGDRSGVLNTSARTNEFVDFEAEEHGYVIVIFSLIPRVDYNGGTKKFYLKDSMADVYKPEYDAVGFQDIYRSELDGLTTGWNQSYGKQVSWFEYMTNYNELHGLFTQQDRSFMTLARDTAVNFVNDDTSPLTTYIEPWDFQNIFQETALWKDNFYIQARFDITCYQPMSKQLITSW